MEPFVQLLFLKWTTTFLHFESETPGCTFLQTGAAAGDAIPDSKRLKLSVIARYVGVPITYL